MRAHLVNWQNIHKKGDLWIKHHQLRYDAFVDRQHWTVPSHEKLEWDQYDTPRAQYVLIEHNNACVAACRLISTIYPYMIEEVFPNFLPYEVPKTESVWETTRFVVDASLTPDLRRVALGELIIAVQQFGLDHNLDRFVAVMAVPMFKRALVRNGVDLDIHVDRACLIDNKNTTAADVYISQATIDYIRENISGKMVA